MSTPPTPRASAVVVTYNSASTIEACLGALRRCHDAAEAHAIVVDNASSDATKSILQRHADWATIIASPGNIGFGRGCNLGLEHARTKYVVFVNPDAELEPAACATLSSFLDAHERAGMVAPAIIEEGGELQHVGGLTTPAVIIREACGRIGVTRGRRVAQPGAEAFQTDWVCGALFMSPVALLRELRGFDPRFFLYFEETDLCLRVAHAGHELWAVPAAVARHVGGASAALTDQSRIGGCIAEHFFRSRFYYLRKHFGLIPAAGAELGELALYALRAAARLVRGRGATELTRRFHWPILRTPAHPRPGA